MRVAHAPRPAGAWRSGFTLMEILVVIAIIAILFALTASAAMYFMGWGRETAAKATLRKLDSGLRQEWTAGSDQAKAEFHSGAYPGTLMQAANQNPDTALQLWIYLRLRQEFPTSFAEATGGFSYTYNGTAINMPPKQFYVSALANVPTDQQLQAQGKGPPRESSALLLLALSPQARRGQAVPIEESIGTASIQNSNGISAILDGWGTPVQFTGAPAQFTLGNSGLTPAVISAGKDKTFGTNDDINSVSLRLTTTGGQ